MTKLKRTVDPNNMFSILWLYFSQ